MIAWRRLRALAQALLLVSLVQALDINYCSPDNTGSSFQPVEDSFQSNGACQDTCKSSYAFAVLQGQNCWCSNYAPGYSVNTLNCQDACPGYPREWCGSSSSGLYAYFQLTLSPSGTSARSSARPPSTRESSTTAPAPSEQPAVNVTKEAPSPSPSSSEPIVSTKVVSTTVVNTLISTPTTTPTPTTLVTSSSTFSPSPTPLPTEAPSLVPSVITVTQNGTTITSTASVAPSTDPALGQSSSPPSGGNPGRMAGIAIGAAVSLAAILGLAFWLYLRRRKQNLSPPRTPESDRADGVKGLPTRHASQMSQAGLIDKNPRIVTTGLPIGSNSNSAGTSLSPSNRYSAGTDLRLNPNAIYTCEESQHSSVSLQDNRDYSRQLQVRNPDS
ncbi:hypothetical protein GJ744_000194 [Endocarpon pusillum]|uniref:WSC domain-containing protein n=1 Tax=Endocarpon pusillum TaxID=364733 RepID=A0A8H7AU44_9EURO|nr:hypothetical protein GJ744_000194 [Endocarpon pusillum]